MDVRTRLVGDVTSGRYKPEVKMFPGMQYCGVTYLKRAFVKRSPRCRETEVNELLLVFFRGQYCALYVILK
jgi:hypothetical protein